MKATWDSDSESELDDEVQEEVTNMCFMAIDTKTPKKKKNKNLCFLDSVCSKHMIGDFSKFSTFTKKDGGFVTFGDNAKGKIIRNSSPPIIENLLLVDNLNHNLLSISQLCDKGYRVVFESSKYLIENAYSKEVIFVDD